jgi:hypothetical protein
MLYQSSVSNTCAICAVANLLSLYGLPWSREQAFAAFWPSVPDSESGVDHAPIFQVIDQQFRNGLLRWKYIREFSFDGILRALQAPFRRGAPALLTFHVQHRERNWRGIHCVVAVAGDHTGIHIIDSMGRRDRRVPNATIMPDKCSRGWHVAGAPIVVNKSPARILDGLPPITDRSAA